MAQPLFVGQKLELFVEKLSFNGGRGVARNEGIVIFVEDAAPRETVLAEVTKVHKRHADARVVEIIEPSPFRRAPICPVYLQCGGCNMQHIDYATQVKQKSQILEDQLRNLNKQYNFEIRPFIASEKEFHYRNRVQFQVQGDKVGFFKRGTHQIVDTDRCFLVDDEINVSLQELRKKINKPSRVELRSSQSSGADFFSQINSDQNLKLQGLISELITLNPNLEMWDLYGGAGNFSLPVALRFPDLKIVCVEGSKEAVQFGHKRASELKLNNISWVHSPVEDFLKGQPKKPRHILLDPPRAGLSDTSRIRLEAYLNGSNLIYLSCNPASFSRDALEILASSNLKLRWVQGIDMFPQTDHIELLSYFN